MSDGILKSKHSSLTSGLAYVIWLVSAFLGVISCLAGRELIIRTYLRFFPGDALEADLGGLSLLNIMITLPLAALAIAIIIGGFEYQHRNMGRSDGWKMLARTLAVEFGFLLLALYI